MLCVVHDPVIVEFIEQGQELFSFAAAKFFIYILVINLWCMD